MKFAALTTLAIATLAVATPARRQSECDSGSLQCCNSTQSPTSSVISELLGLLGVNVGSLTGLVGVTCTPITVVGVSGTQCQQQSVCCTDNSFNGVIATGCTPVNVNV